MLARLFGTAAAIGLLATATAATAAVTVNSDPILYWNEVALGLVLGPAPVQTRTFAMLNIAMHDAVNATAGNPDSGYLHGVATPGGDSRAAASQAAFNVLSALNPGNTAAYQTALTASLALVGNGQSKTDGIATGNAFGTAIRANRAADGSAAVVPYLTTGLPGDWRPTPPGNGPAALPQWGDVTPFVMSSSDQFRPGPPPALDSAEYAAAYNQVKKIGSATSATRLPDETASALFWDAANGATWLRIGVIVAEDEGLDTLGFARSFATLTTSLADALIAGFDAKYEYRLWRPVTAIRLGDTDGNDATAGDAGWTSLFPAPAHPSYVSTHAALSGAGASTLLALFGEEGFTFTIAGDTRTFTGLEQAALDGANSRLWGGIHFAFDNAAGLQIGRQIGARALAGPAFNAVPEPTTWAMMVGGFGLVGALRRRRGAAVSAAA